MPSKSSRRLNKSKRPKIRSTQKNMNHGKSINAKYYCNDRNYNECYDYLLSVTNNNPAVHQLFNILNTENRFSEVKNNRISLEQVVQQDYGLHGWGIFCGGSECGNFYGVGGCNGGQACCGVGGLGIGCNYKMKNKHGSTN